MIKVMRYQSKYNIKIKTLYLLDLPFSHHPNIKFTIKLKSIATQSKHNNPNPSQPKSTHGAIELLVGTNLIAVVLVLCCYRKPIQQNPHHS